MTAWSTVSDGTLGADHRRVEGVVVDRFDAPVEGADVAIECDYHTALPKQHTGPSGAFAFDVDPECMFLLRADKSGDHATAHRRLTGTDRPIRIKLHPLSLGVVRVVDQDTGAPVAGATVSASEMFSDETTTVTGPDGIARLKLLLPTQIYVSATDYVQVTDLLDDPRHPSVNHHLVMYDNDRVESATEAHLDIKLSRGVFVSGAIVGPDGNAVPTAEIRVMGPTNDAHPPGATTHSDASGRFELTLPRAGHYRIWAENDDLTVTGPRQFDVTLDGQSNLVVHLVRRAQVFGVVVDARFNPVEGAKVSTSEGWTPPAITDAKGRFAIRAQDDSPVDLIARLGADSSAFQRVQVEYGKQVEIVLQIDVSGISGTAVDSDGTPVPGAIVWLNGCCASNPSLVGTGPAVADASGKFMFNVPRGDYVLSVKRTADDDFEDEDDVTTTGGARDVKVIVP